jgi:ABC-type nickel/cobalt efflux system permease component RcnA
MLQQQTLLAVLGRLFPVKVSRLAIFSAQFGYVGSPERDYKQTQTHTSAHARARARARAHTHTHTHKHTHTNKHTHTKKKAHAVNTHYSLPVYY